MAHSEDWGTAVGVLRLASQLVDGIQDGLARRGFDDVRPLDGFAFVLLSEAPTTTVRLAEHLGVTKQAASELVQQLVGRGYVTRVADPADRRAKLLVLTDRGRACTRAAERAASDTVAGWEEQLTADQLAALRGAVAALATPGRLRPTR